MPGLHGMILVFLQSLHWIVSEVALARVLAAEVTIPGTTTSCDTCSAVRSRMDRGSWSVVSITCTSFRSGSSPSDVLFLSDCSTSAAAPSSCGMKCAGSRSSACPRSASYALMSCRRTVTLPSQDSSASRYTHVSTERLRSPSSPPSSSARERSLKFLRKSRKDAGARVRRFPGALSSSSTLMYSWLL